MAKAPKKRSLVRALMKAGDFIFGTGKSAIKKATPRNKDSTPPPSVARSIVKTGDFIFGTGDFSTRKKKRRRNRKRKRRL